MLTRGSIQPKKQEETKSVGNDYCQTIFITVLFNHLRGPVPKSTGFFGKNKGRSIRRQVWILVKCAEPVFRSVV